MRKVLLTLGILALVCTPAMAGRNADGALVVHTNDAYNWSNLTVCTQTLAPTCEELNTVATRDADQVVWLVAAFNQNASPGVTVIYFGINYDDVNLDPGVNFRFCGPGGSLEVPDDDWPYSGRGNSVAFGSAVYSNLFAFYAFRISGGTDGAYFCTDVNPTGGYAAFVDDSNPPLIDNVYRFGCVRWFAPGENNCPVIQLTGACCLPNGDCLLVNRDECGAVGGQYQGDGTVCDPNPCPIPGACCFEDGHCEVLFDIDCAAQGGQFYGGDCTPGLCPQPAGACCDVYGNCSFVPEAECTGTFLGGPCDPNPCTIPPMGACCDAQGGCTLTYEIDCQGTWQGADTVCDPNPCEVTATESTTWGQIKANYR